MTPQPMGESRPQTIITWILMFVLGPLVLYSVFFIVLSWPLPLSFSSHYWTDKGDGLQMVWNFWWVDTAITKLHQHPWFTNYLYYPYGVHLLGHTLHPFKCFLGIPLLRYFSLTQTYNLAVAFSFVASGYTAFWLAWHVARSWSGSLLAGYIFTFSPFHWTHAAGHMQLMSMEWIPMFVLFWILLLNRPRFLHAVLASFFLFLVFLSDHYYFFYCFLFGVIAFTWKMIALRNPFFFKDREYLAPLALFILLTLCTSGIFALWIVKLNAQDPILGAHRADWYSMDLLAPFIPGYDWKFANLTKEFWADYPGGFRARNRYVGWSVLCMAAIACIRYSRFRRFQIGLWLFVAAFFFVMALGPHLSVGLRIVSSIPMPYRLLEIIIPPLRLGGVPDRMFVMTMLALSLICAMVTAAYQPFSRKGRVWMGLFFILLFVEYLPIALPETKMELPGYVQFLANQPNNDPVIDTTMSHGIAMYYQTVHEKPMSFGYTSRTPLSVVRRSNILHDVINQALEHGKFRRLRDEYGFRYIVIDAEFPIAEPNIPMPQVYQDDRAVVYDMDSELSQ